VNPLFEITDADRARWQRRAAAVLVAVLNEHPGLPLIAWMVGTAGASLVGRVDGQRTAEQARAAFEAWCAVLGVDQRRETSTVAGTHLWATARAGDVTVRLTATSRDDAPPGAGR
jgi:hypothetical protein